MRKISVFITILFLIGCGTNRNLTSGKLNVKSNLSKAMFLPGVSADPTYGFTIENPVCLGGNKNQVRANEIEYFSALFDADGNPVVFEKIGERSTGSISDQNTTNKLHLFRVRSHSLGVTDTIYVSVGKYEQPYAPVGFTIKKARD